MRILVRDTLRRLSILAILASWPMVARAQDSLQLATARRDSLALAAIAAEFARDSIAALRVARTTADSTLRASVRFAPGGVTLSRAARALLERKALYLAANPSVRLRVTGNSDGTATGAAAEARARERVLAVRAALVELGIEPARIEIVTPDEVPRRGARVDCDVVGEITEVQIAAPGARPPPLYVEQRLGGPPPRAVNWGVVRVFYATDRSRTGDATPATFYGKDRNPRGELELGALDVTIPRTHRVGVIEQPAWYRLELSADPRSHMTVRDVRPMTTATFLDSLRATVASSSGKEALVFIHGFNVSFEAAALRTAQLAYDLGFNGAPVMYSWPSKGSIFGYAADAEEAAWTTAHLRAFLDSIVRVTGARRVHLIAHSMGNRVLTGALQAMHTEHPDTLFNQVVLTAPDLDADIFTQQIAPAIRGSARRITIYASSQDKALRAARVVSTHARVGSTAGRIVTVDGMDTIDASKVDTDLLGHGYFASNRLVLDDLLALLRQNLSPASRHLERVAVNAKVHWRIP